MKRYRRGGSVVAGKTRKWAESPKAHAIGESNEKGRTKEDMPGDVVPHRRLELLLLDVLEQLRRADDARVRKKHVQPAVLGHGLVHDALDGRLVRGVEAARVYVDPRIQGVELADVRRQVRVAVVADEDGAGAVGGEEVRGRAADAEGGVAAWENARGTVLVQAFGGYVGRDRRC